MSVPSSSTAASTSNTSPAAPPSAAPSAKEPGEFYGLVFATIPAILAYFIGWAYLYYYLGQFGIGISELELGLETIFIFSAPPLLWILRSYWPLLLVLAVGAGSLRLLRNRLPIPVQASVAFVSLRFGKRSLITRALIAFAFLVVAVLMLSPLIRRAAVERADQKWTREGVSIQAAVAKPGEPWSAYDDYQKCLDRRALDLILADHDGYFMLCVSEIDENVGNVYEVKREGSVLTSARAAQRANTE